MNHVPRAKRNHVFSEHAAVFGVTGVWNTANTAIFEQILHNHANDPAVVVIKGTYRSTIQATHYFDPATALFVMVDSTDELISAWRLLPKRAISLWNSGNIQ